MRRPRMVVAAALGLLVAACSNDAATTAPKPGEKPAENKATDPATAVVNKLDEVESFLSDNSKSLTPELYEKMVLALESCTMKEDGIDYQCPALKNLDKARNRNTSLKDLVGASTNIGKKHIGHASPAVRLQSARMMGSIFGSGTGTQEVIVAAAEKEQEPAVLRAMLNVVGSRHKSNPAVTALLMKNAEHANEKVRMESLGWFVSVWSEGMPKTFDKVLEHLEKDPSVAMRGFLCSNLHKPGDDRAMPQIEKYLNGKDTPKELFDGCFNGAINSWTGFPFPDKPQKKGYELTMKVLNTKPRTKDRPPWSGISTLRASKTEFKPNDSFGPKWFEKVKDFYKKDKLIAALEGMATDENANWMGRSGALDVMQELGAPKATFEAIAKKYAAGTGENVHIKNKAETLIKKM